MSQDMTLNEEQKAYFHALLNRILDEMVQERRTSAGEKDLSEYKACDLIDLASIEIDSALSFRIRERDGRLAEKVRQALNKLQEGTFGICEECGRPIPERRLRARPVARLCIKCKEKQENEERMRGND